MYSPGNLVAKSCKVGQDLTLMKLQRRDFVDVLFIVHSLL